MLLLVFICFLQIITGNNTNITDVKQVENLILEYINEDNAKADSLCDLLINGSVEKNQNNLGLGFFYKGEIAYYQAEWNNAAQYYQKAIDFFKNSNDTAHLAITYNNLGIVWLYQSLFNKSLEAITQSLECEKKLNNNVGIAQSYQNISMVYENQEKYDKAIEYNLLALEILKETDNEVDLAGAYNNQAVLCINMNNLKDAEIYYLKAMEIYKKLELTDKEAKVLCNIGNLLVRQEKYGEGGLLLERALALFRLNNDVMSEIHAYGMLADLYAKKNEYLQAIFLTETALKMAEETEARSLQLKSLYSLYFYYKKTEKWVDALHYYENYTELKDKLLTFDSSIGEDIIKIEFEHKLSEIDVLNMQKTKIEKTFGITIIALLLIFVAVSVVIHFYIRKLKENLSFSKIEQNLYKKQTKLSLSSMFSRQYAEKEKINKYLPALTELLEKTYDFTENKNNTINAEIEFIKEFINIFSNLYNKEIQFRLETNISDNELINISIPSMLFKPTIDHFLFCLPKDNEFLNFNIAFIKKDNTLYITVEDNISQQFYKNYDTDGIIKDSEIALINRKIKLIDKKGKNCIFQGMNFEGEKTRYNFEFQSTAPSYTHQDH